MHRISRFRHDPVRATSEESLNSILKINWAQEPVVGSYLKLLTENLNTKLNVSVPISATPLIVSGVGVVITSDDGYIRFYSLDLKKVFWERRLNASIYSSPVFDRIEKTIIVTSTRGLVICLDLQGKMKWNFNLGHPAFANQSLLSDGFTLVFSLFNSHALALNIKTGEIIFQVDLPKPWHVAEGSFAGYRDAYASPVATQNNHVVICCAEDVLCFSSIGVELWRQKVGHSIKASPVLIESTSEVFVTLVNGDCLFLSLLDGTIHHKLNTGSKITASSAISKDVIIVGLQGEVSLGISVLTREIVWKSDQGSSRSYTSYTLLPDGNFIFTNARGNIVALDALNGNFIWESSQVLGISNQETPMDITPIVDSNGFMYCASYEGDIYYFFFSKIK